MASSLLSLVLMSLLITNLSYASCNVITKVCSETQNQPLCYKTLKSDPRSAKANLKGIGYISIGISKRHAKKTYKYVVSLSKQATDPRRKDQYDTCVENYEDAIDLLNEAKKALRKDDISSFRTYASAAFDGPVTCEDSFEDSPAPKQLQKANMKSQGLIGIVLAVGAILDGKQ